MAFRLVTLFSMKATACFCVFPEVFCRREFNFFETAAKESTCLESYPDHATVRGSDKRSSCAPHSTKSRGKPDQTLGKVTELSWYCSFRSPSSMEVRWNARLLSAGCRRHRNSP